MQSVENDESVGGNETIVANVRILAATNRELERAIADGRFREDLYHRLNVVTIDLPPLRQRQSDIPLLVEYFLERFSQALKIDKPPLSDEALNLLVQHPWPGNVRELDPCLQRTVIFTQGHSIQAADLQLQRYEEASQNSQPALLRDVLPALLSSGSGLSHQVHQFLDSYHGTRAHAEFLGG